MGASGWLDGGALALLAVAVFLVIVVIQGLKIVPQSQQFVVTRLGRYHRTLGPGVNLLVPFLDQVHIRTPVLDQVLPDMRLDVVSKDNVVFRIEIAVFYRIEVPEKAVFRVDNIENAVKALVSSLVRAEIGKLELDAVQSDRASLSEEIKQALQDAAEDYGIKISRAEIVNVELDDSTRMTMQEVLSAERERRATVTRAEGQKRAIELKADADLYAAQRAAEAQRVAAEADAFATRQIAEAIRDSGEQAAAFQLGLKQVEGISALAGSANAKLILLPGAVTDGFTQAAAILADRLTGERAAP
jgi:regulator of protease activity HflC (stomatin/prohibitin superfamily)